MPVINARDTAFDLLPLMDYSRMNKEIFAWALREATPNKENLPEGKRHL
jgi:hypothetical protein